MTRCRAQLPATALGATPPPEHYRCTRETGHRGGHVYEVAGRTVRRPRPAIGGVREGAGRPPGEPSAVVGVRFRVAEIAEIDAQRGERTRSETIREAALRGIRIR